MVSEVGKKEKTVSKPLRLLLAILSSILLVWGLAAGPLANTASAVNVGANPTPKVDIAVALPSDYPGTFLEFKQELTQKLIDQGMDQSTFRITDTAAKIDTSNTDGWYVYDHYRDASIYNALNLSSDQKNKQPQRYQVCSGGTATIASKYNPSTGILDVPYSGVYAQCLNFDRHIYNFTSDDGKTSMIFAGYNTIAGRDYMLYPAPSNARRTFSFDVDGSKVLAHTLDGAGFLMNAGIDSSGNLQGYYLYLVPGGDSIGGAQLRKINSSVAASADGAPAYTEVKKEATNLGSCNKARFTVELNKDNVTIQKQNYDRAGNLGSVETLFGGRVDIADSGFNGFGPMVCYKSHSCSKFTQFSYLDLEMSYDSSAFDALKTTQYYEQAQQKYFINLAGDSNDPQIPDESDETYADGINRMNENEIFYISNAQDGKIVTDTVKDADGKVTHQGLGSSNGYIAMSDDYVTEMAEYIYTSFIEGKTFNQAPVTSDIPLANFYMIDKATGQQLMTVHQRHLFNTGETVKVNFFDKSIVGQLAGADGKISQWNFKVYDPDNNVKYESGWKTDPNQIADYTFDSNSVNGKWIFELQVKDQNGNESKASQTYIVAFLDNEHPFIKGENSGRNEATITLTDTGQGIDDDGITFIEDGRGSGVAAYWYTNDPAAEPSEDDWEYLDEPVHQHAFKYEITDTQPLVVWVKDECGNIGNKAVFQPTRVIVQDPDGKPIDDYIVIEENPIIVLPDEDDLDDPEDPNEKFAGWTTPGGDPVTPGTTVPKGDDHTIIIRPSYAKDYANVVYLANGGTIAENSTAAFAEFQVVSGNSLKQKIEDHNVKPVREGYSFDGWKLVEGNTNAVVNGLVNKAAGTSTASGSQLVDPSDKTAKLVLKDPEGNPRDEANIVKSNYYLVAQWKIGDYTVRLDPNGGSLAATRAFEGVKYQTNVGTLPFPVQGRTIPTKPGYIFQGWSTTKNAMEQTKDTFLLSSAASGITPVAAPTMPAHDITVYAVWKEDKTQFVVHFDSQGGSRVADQAYKSATTNNYSDFKKPTRSGYDFAGWYPVGADGSLGTKSYEGGEELISKTEQTFQAKWTPRNDTKYTVDYYVNSGNKDAQGNYIYNKVNDSTITKSYTGTTEATVTVPEADKTAEITVGGKPYWFNPDSARTTVDAEGNATSTNNNVITGQITGNPLLSLKLYYDRFFDVTAIKDRTSTGDGTLESALKQKEGSTPTVTWKANEGSHVASVVVNGVVRDDLVNAGSYTVENPLEGNVGVTVKFVKDAEPSGGDKPTPPKPPVTDNTHFTIKTEVKGAINASDVIITPTQSVKNGNNTQVVWGLPENSRYTIAEVTIDDVALSEEEIAAGKVSFNKVSQGHKVVVTVKSLPSLGGMDTSPDPVNPVDPVDPDDPVNPDGPKQTADKYTLTVNRYGGDDKVVVSPSVTVNAGEKPSLSWNATGSEDWQIMKIIIDGQDITPTLNERQLQSMNYRKGAFSKGFDANHVVDIYMAPTPKAPEPGPGVDPTPTPDPVIPDYTDPEQFIKITTKIVGTEGNINGHITGGAVVTKDPTKEYGVDWSLKANDGDNDGVMSKIGDLEQGDDGYYYAPTGTDDDKYVCYELVRVLVNGEEQPKDELNGKVAVKQDSDKVVEVQVRPVLHTVTVVKYGDGSVSPSKSVYHLGNYRDIKAEEANGSKLVKIVVDGEIIYEATGIKFDTDAPAAETQAVEALSAAIDDESVKAEDATDAEAGADASDAASTPATDNVTKDEADKVATKSTKAAEAEETDVEAADGNQAKTADVADAASAEVAISDDENPSAHPLALLLSMLMPAEQVTPSSADADDAVVGGRWTGSQEKVKQDHLIEAYFAKPATNPDGTPKMDLTDPDNPEPIYEPIPESLHSVSAVIVGGEGTVVGNAMVADGADASLTVTPNTGYEIAKVTDQDGNDVTSRLAKGEDGSYVLDVTDVKADQKFEVELKRTPVPNGNEPVPGDLNPVVMHEITTSVQGGAGTIDGSGNVRQGEDRTVTWQPNDPNEKVAYVFIDGVNHPELCALDAEGKGSYTFEDVEKPHHIAVVFATNTNNIDSDGDGEPDINVDPDGDGDPDVNKDTDGDGKPDTDVDTDGDGEPDVNKDTDGDGKPDVNIVDEDGDGKPDPVDPKNPKLPTTNVDTDGDDKPDFNIDTDGDGKPDVNIVDKDGDGKPDPVDPKNPPEYADVNVDVDGDGVPDVNIDTDGDGKPDSKIDANHNGIVDTEEGGDDPNTPSAPVDEDGNKDDGGDNGDGNDDKPVNQPNGSSDDEPGDKTDDGVADTNGGTDDGLGKADGAQGTDGGSSGLSKTGDVMAVAFGALGATALVAALALLIARNRRTRDER